MIPAIIIVFTLIAFAAISYLAVTHRQPQTRLPILKKPVAFVGETDDPQLSRAIEWWHRQLGITDAFCTIHDIGHGDVVTIMHVQGGDFYARTRFQKYTTTVLINQSAVNANPQKLDRALCHELGHLLGLGHSRDRWDVMYPTTIASSYGVSEKSVAKILAKKKGADQAP